MYSVIKMTFYLMRPIKNKPRINQFDKSWENVFELSQIKSVKQVKKHSKNWDVGDICQVQRQNLK